jgi:hypothetical protein
MTTTSTPPDRRSRIEKEWDHHGSYQWTYFPEPAKQAISFYLSSRLPGKNLDVGGGWYSYSDNSVAIDISSVCLKNN